LSTAKSRPGAMRRYPKASRQPFVRQLAITSGNGRQDVHGMIQDGDMMLTHFQMGSFYFLI